MQRRDRRRPGDHQRPLPGSLATLYADIRTRAPAARVVVVGYPRNFNGEDCNAATFFSPAEEARLTRPPTCSTRVWPPWPRGGLRFREPTNPFVGHAVCDDPEWINGLSWPIVESYHPNIDGQAQGYTPTVSPVLTGAAVTATAALTKTALRQTATLERQQRGYANLTGASGRSASSSPT